VQSICFAYFAQLVAVVGSGFLAQDIQTYFGGQNKSEWLSQAITIATVVLSPPFCQYGDLWGRKWIVSVSMLCGFIGSIVASRADSMGTVIAGYCIIGISFGAQPLLHAICSEVLPREKRPLAQACINGTAGFGGFLGVVIGGSLLRHGDFSKYRIYLYIDAAFFFVAAIGVALCYNPPPRELQTTLTFSEKLSRLHWISYGLFTSGLVLFCVGLSYSKNPYQWSDARVSAPFAIGVALLLAFIVYEWRFQKNGIFDHGLFRNRNFALALLLIFCEGLVFFAANSYFSFEIGIVTGKDLLNAGLPFGIVFIASMAIAFIGGYFSSKAKQLRWPITTGYVLMLIAFICLATTTTSNLDGAFWGFAIILGLGLGLILTLVMTVAQLSTPPELLATASALIVSTRSLGGTVGLAINNAVFNDALSTEIPKKIAAATLPLGLPPQSLGVLIGAIAGNDQALLAHVPGITPQIIGAAVGALQSAYEVGFKNAWITSCAFTAVAVIGKWRCHCTSHAT
jgi:MFS family permease